MNAPPGGVYGPPPAAATARKAAVSVPQAATVRKATVLKVDPKAPMVPRAAVIRRAPRTVEC